MDQYHEKSYIDESAPRLYPTEGSDEYIAKEGIQVEDAAVDSHNRKLKRSLKSRHMGMIAIGGTIGTGLFLGSGTTLAVAGPAGSLIAYILIGTMVYFVCTSLGEVSTFIPVSDPFNHFATRFLDPALGFAFGWNYWLSWMLTVGSELVACGLIVKFWLPNLNGIVWSLVAMVIMFAINAISVRGYGEAEYYFAMIKVLAVVIVIIVGILTITGRRSNDHIVGILKACITAAFSFQGTEIVGVTVGESANPRRDVPRAIRSVFWRILLFYILAIMSGGVEDIAISPFTLVFDLAGAKWAAHVMNAVVLITVLSAGNSGLYACTRVLWNMAKEGKAPRIFCRVTKGGVPIWALIFTTFWSCEVYVFLVNISGVTGFLFWLGLSLSHWRFRMAYVRQGFDIKDLPYRAAFYPFGPIYACCLLAVIIVGQGYGTFTPKFDALSFFSTYIALPLFVIMWLGWKFFKKTKVVRLDEADVSSGTLLEMERSGEIEIFPYTPGITDRIVNFVLRRNPREQQS
ncbi:hypothetical protein DL89DRAFT_290057 [Linderina pennispora]|uniref:Amino acid permease/ SLC12A domain-containing protein n=1 Tax=Linderina pennispora TaxID=61395 RepID=A0A1Y1WLR6_9FUNG|nr:uncharacterized protein DL89DRAFT_290057 [Linderina pennispora]ORX74521.1 hypothetical protein DL89DRAFT_290057 [Linderina pennispora]